MHKILDIRCNRIGFAVIISFLLVHERTCGFLHLCSMSYLN